MGKTGLWVSTRTFMAGVALIGCIQ
jgi:ABC-type multidrug transport system fused ATPase/permease subunit